MDSDGSTRQHKKIFEKIKIYTDEKDTYYIDNPHIFWV